MKTKKHEFTRYLPCKLMERELVEITQKAAHKLREIKQREAELKAQTEQEKEEIKALTEEWNGMLIKIRDEQEERPTRVQTILDYEVEECYEVRLDTGEEISRRPLREEERQFTFEEDFEHAQ